MTEQTNNTNVVITIEELLDKTTEVMRSRLDSEGEDFFLLMTPTGFEREVELCLNIAAKETNFENRIKYYGGGRFPDIVVDDIYGVEAKRSKGKKLTTTGNSVLESTRIESVKKIFMFFGKLSKDIAFVWKPYEKCLSDVAVTHYPRYLVNMELGENETIFNKMKTTYEAISSSEEPVKPIVDYYRGLMNPGDSIWWIDNGNEGEEETSNILIRQWNKLDDDVQKRISNEALILFPQLFGNERNKYDDVSIWLLKTHGVVCKNLRDLFTAGGKHEIPSGEDTVRVQHIVSNIDGNVENVVSYLLRTDIEELEERWGVHDMKEGEQVTVWLGKVCDYLKDEETRNHLREKYAKYL